MSKNTGIKLEKGSVISLQKENTPLSSLRVGINWGMMYKKVLLLFNMEENVDLDVSVTMFDKQGTIIDTVYFNQLISKDTSVRHSGDDREGDQFGNDHEDNEVIFIELNRVRSEVEHIYIYLNSYKKKHFGEIPYTYISISSNEGRKETPLASFNLTSEPNFNGKISMILGKISRKEGGWDFTAIGEPLDAPNITGTVDYIQKKYF